MKIKQVEELVGITRKNIRFYEDQGLLNVERAENGGLSSLARGIFLFGSFLRRFDRRFRRRGGFSFNELIQLLTADRNSLE